MSALGRPEVLRRGSGSRSTGIRMRQGNPEQFERKTVWEGVVHVYALEGHPTASQHQPPDEVGEGGAGGVVKHRLPTIIVIDFLPTPLLPR
jgi:hypothetical protein